MVSCYLPVFGQVNKPVLDLKKFTDRTITVRQMMSVDRSCYELMKNGAVLQEGTDYFIGSSYPNSYFFVGGGTRGGFYQVEVDFGFLRPNDVLTVRDKCTGEVSDPVVVSDDYVYIEVPNGNSFSGNGIDPNYSSPAYTKLATSVEVGKCEPVSINAHVLMATVIDITTGNPINLGSFKVNGVPITGSSFSSYTAGNSTTYSINAQGEVTTSNFLKLTANTYYSGAQPYSLEYTHNASNTNDFDFTIGVGGVQIRFIHNNSFEIWKRNYLGEVDISHYDGDFSNATFKLTFDENYYRVYVNNVEYGSLARFVKYSFTGGSLSNTNTLPYRTGVTFSPSNTGGQLLNAVVDGALNIYQRFNIAEDLSATSSVVNAGCSGGSTGSITMEPSGGKPPYSYSLNNGTFQSSATFGNLSAGSYAVKVKDASGCDITRQVTVSQNPELTLTVALTYVTCVGGNNGSATLTASGGLPTYSYSLDGTHYGATNEFSSLEAGTYTFYVKDAVGCVKTIDNQVVNTRSVLRNPVVSITDVSCNGASNGRMEISASNSNPVGTIQYSIDNGQTFRADSVFSQLSAGRYTVVIKDALCSNITNWQIAEASLIITNAIVSGQITCHGLQNGVIKANPSGGNAPYTYSKDNSTYSVNNTFSDLSAGNYKIWVKDNNGCIRESGILTVIEPRVLADSVVRKTDVTCFGGSDGNTHVIASGGTSPYTFKLTTQSTFSSESTFSGLSAGSYTIQIKDANQCNTTASVEILEPPAITLSASIQQQVTCHGGNNGVMLLTAAGGTGALSYSKDGNTYQISNRFNTLVADSYTMYVKDVNGCTNSLNNTSTKITEPASLVVGATLEHVSCYGGTNGKITIVGSGGTRNFQYSNDGINYVSDSIFAGLPQGRHKIYIKDANNCVSNNDFTITQPNDLVPYLRIAQQVKCFGESSGNMIGFATGGTLPYQFSKDGTIYQADSLFEGLSIGSYKIWIKDAKGCVGISSAVSVVQPENLVLLVEQIKHVTCKAGNDGQVRLSATGGTGTYQYAKNSLSFQVSPVFSQLTSQRYTFTVKDENACAATTNTTVIEPDSAYTIALASKTNLSCFDNKTGQIVLSHHGGTPSYQLSLDNQTFQSGTTFGQLDAGTYQLYGKDGNNCRFSLSGIVLTQPTDIQFATLYKKDVDCDYYTKGEATILATGSNGNFNYTLTGIDNQHRSITPINNNSGVFVDMPAGDYRVTATDYIGCSKVYPISIIAKNSKITFDINKSIPTTCTSTDGVISITNVKGGRNGYFYQLSTQTNSSTNNTFSSLLNGTYVVTVSDELCYYRQSVDLRNNNSIRAAYSISGISCNTPEANLLIQPITGGNGNYQLSLNGGEASSTQRFTNLSPNVYAITIVDTPVSCRTVLSVEIKEQNRADLQLVQKDNILCFGGNSGRIEVLGNNNQAPFTYTLNNGAWQTSNIFSGLVIGTYKITALNAMGCQDSIRVTLSQPTALTNVLSKKDNLCFGDSTGEIQVATGGGIAPYQYSIDGTQYQTSNTFSQLTKGDYTIVVKDQHNCTLRKATTLIQPSQIVVTPMYQDTIRCYGEANGTIAVKATGGTPTYTYSKDGINYFASELFDNLAKGIYQLYVKDNNQCVRSKELSITEPAVLALALKETRNPLCFGSVDGSIRVQATGGNGTNVFKLDIGSVIQSKETFEHLPKGIYAIQVSDRKGCQAQVNSIQLTEPTKIVSNATGVMPLCFGNENGEVAINMTGGTPGYQIRFQDQLYKVDTLHQYKFEKLGAKRYTFYVIDTHACVDTLQYTLNQPTPLSSQITLKSNDCFGDQTGRIQVVAQQATPPYRYAYEKSGKELFDSTGTFDKLFAGKYTVTVYDNNNCKLSKQVEVLQPTQLVLTPIYQDTVRCFQESNGSILIKARGGTPSYLYSKDNTNFYTDSLFSKLSKGTYHFWVKDAHRCTTSTLLDATEPTLLELTVEHQQNPLCLGEKNGIVTLIAKGGNGANTFWQDNVIEQYQNSQFKGLSQGDYTFKVVDRKGCLDTVRLVQLRWPTALKAQIQQSQPICYGTRTASLQLNASGGVGGYVAQLMQNQTNVLNEKKGDTIRFDLLKAGEYRVRLSDRNGCQLLIPSTIVETDSLEMFELGTGKGGDTLCIGQAITLNVKNHGKSIQWFFNEIEDLAQKNKTEYTVVNPGIYKAKVSNNTGCVVEKSFRLTNNQNALKADFILPTQAFVGDTIVALDITKPIPDRIIWILPSDIQIVYRDNNKAMFIPVVDGEKRIGMYAYAGSCENFLFRNIKIFKPEDINQTDSLYQYKARPITSASIYPNPNQGKFSLIVRTKIPADLSIRIVRVVSGEVVHQATLAPQTTDLNANHTYLFDLNLRIGVYSLILDGGTQRIVKQLIITDY